MAYHFEYISTKDKKVIKARDNIMKIIKEVQNEVRDRFTFAFTPVGSYKRNMITYDPTTNSGFDFDFNLSINDDEEKFTPKEIRDILRDAFNKTVPKYSFDFAEDSTRVLTIKNVDKHKSMIRYSCDFALVYNYINNDGYRCQQYIYYNKKANEYQWRERSNGYYALPDKIKWIKEQKLWDELRYLYIERKNKTGEIKPSREVLADSINSICQKFGYDKIPDNDEQNMCIEHITNSQFYNGFYNITSGIAPNGWEILLNYKKE